MTSGPPEPDSAQLRKARGAFFTPPELCRHMADWAIRAPTDVVLEPSCGEAAFLVAAAERMSRLEPANERAGQLHGVDVHAASVDQARRNLAGKYPFAPGSKVEATSAEIGQVFGPEGVVAKFVTASNVGVGALVKKSATSIRVGYPVPARFRRA